MSILRTLLALAAALALSACSESKDAAPAAPPKPTVTMYMDSVGKQFEITKAMAAEFEKASGIAVAFRVAPQDPTERLAEIQKFFSAGSGEFDVLALDVVWPGLLANHLADLKDAVNPAEHFPAMAANSTVGGAFLAVPFYADAGLLYWRTDLAKAYGFDAAPKTWDELEAMAKKIMEGERAKGNPRFFGFAFQGAAYEGLMCNAVEWQTSAGAGWNWDAGAKSLSFDASRAGRMLDRVRGWIGSIAPEGTLTGKEEEARMLFQSGNAAFMRNWPYCWQLGQAEGSAIKGKFDIAPLPAGERPAACLGGWNLGVSRHSKNVDAAKKWVAFLSTKEAQRRRAIEGGYFATRPDVYGDPEIAKAVPYFDRMKDVFLNAAPRPSTLAGAKYSELSSIVTQAVHRVLSGEAQGEAAMREALEKIGKLGG